MIALLKDENLPYAGTRLLAHKTFSSLLRQAAQRRKYMIVPLPVTVSWMGKNVRSQRHTDSNSF